MKKDVRQAVIGNDEAVPLGDIEPLDDAGELDDARRLICVLAPAPGSIPYGAPSPFGPTPSDAMTQHAAALFNVSSGRFNESLYSR